MVYDDLDFCNAAMDCKVEVDSMRIGSSGKQTFSKSIDGDMATEDVINFNVPTSNFVGVESKFSDSENADALGVIAKEQEKIAKKGLKKPMYAILEKSKFEQICAQKATARRLFPRIDQQMVTADMITVDSLNAYMRGKGYPQFLVIDTYATIEHKDGKQETIKPWNENVITLSPIPQLGWTYYKPVPNVPNTGALQQQASYYKMTRYSEINPMLEVTMAEAYVQPGLINRASLVFINTEAATWNNGEAK